MLRMPVQVDRLSIEYSCVTVLESFQTACADRGNTDVGMPAQIHWFSIINSCVTVLLLTGFLATILMRVLKNDFIKYTRDDDGARPGDHTCQSCACVARA